MLLLAGLMGMMVVGATAFIGSEILSKPEVGEEMIQHASSDEDADCASQHDNQPCDTKFIDCLTREHQAEFKDFSIEEDNLLVVYDDRITIDPKLSLELDDTNRSRQHVILDGIRVASVENAEGFNIGHVRLVGQSVFDRGVTA